MSVTLTSRLDAVNVILGAAGESPVGSVTGTTADAAAADGIIQEISREMQSEGWHFNTETDVPFTPDSDGFINLPSSVLNIDVDGLAFPNIDPVQRGSKLYDKAARSYVFTTPIKAEVIYMLEFEDLPEAARRYVAVKSARVFHDRYIGSEVEHRFTADDESRSRAVLDALNMDNQDANIFTGNPLFAQWLRRQ